MFRYVYQSTARPPPPPFDPLLRGAILIRTYGTHINLYISLVLLTVFGPTYYGPSQQVPCALVVADLFR